MNRYFLICATIGLTAISALGANYEVNFKNGKFPSKVGAENVNGLLPVSDHYQRAYTRYGWVVSRFVNEYVAMSPTSTDSDRASENRLTLPTQEISAGDVLRWTARSLLDVTPESYYIEALIDGQTSPIILASVAKENAKWTTHWVDISRFVGKSVVFRFVCNSQNKYMLMLHDIFIGTPAEANWCVENRTPAYTDMDEAKICLDVTNFGAADDSDVAVCIANGKEVDRIQLSGEWGIGENRKLEFEGVTELNAITNYEVSLMKEGVVTAQLCSGSYFSSNFVRRHLVDKGTGTWCSNCPDGILLMENLEEKFGNQLVAVETHVGSDPMTNQGYWNNLDFYAAPYFKLNRIAATAQSNLSQFTNYYDTPVTMGIDVVEVNGTEEHASVTVNVRGLSDFNNYDDRYKIGYVLVKNFYEPTNQMYHQQNNISTPAGERFYILPNPIPPKFIKYHNTSVTSAEAFGGIEHSIPATLPVDGAQYVIDFDCPDNLESLDGVTIAVFILDGENGQVMNADKAVVFGDPSGVKRVTTDSPSQSLKYEGYGTFSICCDGAYELTIYDLSGKIVEKTLGNANSNVTAHCSASHGIYIARLITSQGVESIKVCI